MRITNEHVKKFNRILDLLEAAYRGYETVGECHGKSSDGYAALTFPPYFWREDSGAQPGVEIWSYVLPISGRSHHFDTLDEALEIVYEWYVEMLEKTTPCEKCGELFWECYCGD